MSEVSKKRRRWPEITKKWADHIGVYHEVVPNCAQGALTMLELLGFPVPEKAGWNAIEDLIDRMKHALEKQQEREHYYGEDGHEHVWNYEIMKCEVCQKPVFESTDTLRAEISKKQRRWPKIMEELRQEDSTPWHVATTITWRLLGLPKDATMDDAEDWINELKDAHDLMRRFGNTEKNAILKMQKEKIQNLEMQIADLTTTLDVLRTELNAIHPQ